MCGFAGIGARYLCPYSGSFCTVAAHLYFCSGAQHRLPEPAIVCAAPNGGKGFFFQVSEAVFGIFIETAGHHQAIPGYNAGVPHFPAVVKQFIFDAIVAVAVIFVARIVIYSWDKR